MAGRKDKNTVDYFPHFCNSGKTLFIIENKYGNNGYAVLFKTFELLGNAENHFIDCRNIETWEYLQAKMKLMQTELQAIYDTLANLGTIHKELWQNKIIWSGNFLKNIKDVYKRRNSDCLQFYNICKQLSIKCKHKYDSDGNYVDENIQSKVKESKVKESKEKPLWANDFKNYNSELIYPFEFPEFTKAWDLWIDYRKEKRLSSYKKIGEQSALNQLSEISCNNIQTAIRIINKSIANNWQGLFELKTNGKQSNQIPGEILSEIASIVHAND